MTARDKVVYLSYAWPDRGFVESLRTSLRGQGITSVVGLSEDWSTTSSGPDVERKIADARALIVIVGETTHQSGFMEHEAYVAHKLGKPVLAVKLAPGNVLPPVLYDVEATWTDISRCEGAVVALVSEKEEAAERGAPAWRD